MMNYKAYPDPTKLSCLCKHDGKIISLYEIIKLYNFNKNLLCWFFAEFGLFFKIH